MPVQPILLVEDDADDAALIVLALRKGSLMNPIDVVSDGQAALDYLFAQGAHAGRDAGIQPALILLDLDLPRLSGLQVLERIRHDARTKALPVVILTSSTREDDRLNGYDLGIHSYITKPLDFEAFRAALKELRLSWTLLDAPPAPVAG